MGAISVSTREEAIEFDRTRDSLTFWEMLIFAFYEFDEQMMSC